MYNGAPGYEEAQIGPVRSMQQDQSQGITNMVPDVEYRQQRKEETAREGTTPLYPAAKDERGNWTQRGHVLFIREHVDQGKYPRVFSTFNQAGTKEMALADGDKELARTLFMQTVKPIGVSMHTAEPNKGASYWDTVTGEVTSGRCTGIPVHDDTISTGDWAVAVPPTQKDLDERPNFDAYNELGHSTVGITASIKKYRPESFAGSMVAEVRHLLKPENAKLLGSSIRGADEEDGTMRIDHVAVAVSATVRSILITFLIGYHRMLLRPHPTAGVGMKPANAPVEIGAGSASETIARMYYFFGLSRTYDKAMEDALRAMRPEVLAYWKELAMDIVLANITDGKEQVLEFGQKIDFVPGDFGVSLVPVVVPGESLARSVGNPRKLAENVYGEILGEQLNHIATAFGAAGNAHHHDRKFVIGKVDRINKETRIADITFSKAC